LFLMDSKSSRNVWHPAHISAFPVELWYVGCTSLSIRCQIIENSRGVNP
jgi:hypothetical protein